MSGKKGSYSPGLGPIKGQKFTLDNHNRSWENPKHLYRHNMEAFISMEMNVRILKTRLNILSNWSNICYFDVHVTVHRDKFLIIKPTRCTNFSNLFLKWNSKCFEQFLCPSSGVFTVHTAMVYVIQICWQLVSRRICSCSQAVSKTLWHIPLLFVQWKTPDDWHRNCPKHVVLFQE